MTLTECISESSDVVKSYERCGKIESREGQFIAFQSSLRASVRSKEHIRRNYVFSIVLHFLESKVGIVYLIQVPPLHAHNDEAAKSTFLQLE